MTSSQVWVPFPVARLTAAVRFVHSDLWDRLGDPRVKAYPLFGGGPWATLALVAAYLWFVLDLGPRRLMKGRAPLDLRRPALLYNLLLVAWNGWMFAEGLRLTRWGSDVWGCNVVDPASADERERGKLRVGHLFFLSKLVELCDTLIFVLRRKGSQVTVLHVVHHSLVPLLIWLGFKVSPGGNMALFPLLNSAIHTAMYTYYALSTLGPRVRRRYLWWKRHLTTVQMAQFVVVMVHSLHVLVLPGCHFPRLLLYIQLVNGLLFLVLFYSFYRATYGRPPPSTLTKEPAQETSLVDNNNCLKCH